MPQTKHTPGPWHVVPLRETGRAVAIMSNIDPIYAAYATGLEEQREANAARIVAAVNACDRAGLSNEALDGDVIKTLLELGQMAAEVIDDDLDNLPARHSLGSLHARLRAALRKATEVK